MTLGAVGVVELLYIGRLVGAGLHCPARRGTPLEHGKAQRSAQPRYQVFEPLPYPVVPITLPLFMCCKEHVYSSSTEKGASSALPGMPPPIAVAGNSHTAYPSTIVGPGPSKRAPFGLDPIRCFRIPGRRYTPRLRRRLRLSRRANGHQQSRKKTTPGDHGYGRGLRRTTLGAPVTAWGRGMPFTLTPSRRHRQTSRPPTLPLRLVVQPRSLSLWGLNTRYRTGAT